MARDPYSGQNWTGRAPRSAREAFGFDYYAPLTFWQRVKLVITKILLASPFLVVLLAAIFSK